MAERSIIVGVPLLLLLVMLVLFGVTWLFHHHHWRPFAGIFLFVVGLGVFLVLMGWTRMEHIGVGPQIAPPVAPRAGGFDSGQSTDMRSEMSFKVRTGEIRAGSDRIVAEKPASADSTSTSSTAKTAEAPTSDKKPDWVDRPPSLVFQDNGLEFFETTATSGPWPTASGCEAAITPAINKVVTQYVAEHVTEVAGDELALDPAFIRMRLMRDLRLVRDRYLATFDTSSLKDMKQLYVRLVFDQPVRDALIDYSLQAVREDRLKYAAAGTALTLLLLAGVYSLLRRGVRGPSAAAKAT